MRIAVSRAPGAERVVTPLELFFDLVYVFAIGQLSHHLLEHVDLRSATARGSLRPRRYPPTAGWRLSRQSPMLWGCDDGARKECSGGHPKAGACGRPFSFRAR